MFSTKSAGKTMQPNRNIGNEHISGYIGSLKKLRYAQYSSNIALKGYATLEKNPYFFVTDPKHGEILVASS